MHQDSFHHHLRGDTERDEGERDGILCCIYIYIYTSGEASSDAEKDGDTGQGNGERLSNKVEYHHTVCRPPVKEKTATSKREREMLEIFAHQPHCTCNIKRKGRREIVVWIHR